MALPQHMATVNGVPPLQNGMMHGGPQHPAAQQQQQPGMVPVSALQHDPLGSAGVPVIAEHLGDSALIVLMILHVAPMVLLNDMFLKF